MSYIAIITKLLSIKSFKYNHIILHLNLKFNTNLVIKLVKGGTYFPTTTDLRNYKNKSIPRIYQTGKYILFKSRYLPPTLKKLFY